MKIGESRRVIGQKQHAAMILEMKCTLMTVVSKQRAFTKMLRKYCCIEQ